MDQQAVVALTREATLSLKPNEEPIEMPTEEPTKFEEPIEMPTCVEQDNQEFMVALEESIQGDYMVSGLSEEVPKKGGLHVKGS